MNHGITPSHRGILLGLTTVPKLLALADSVEASPALDSLLGGGCAVRQPAARRAVPWTASGTSSPPS